MLSSEKEQLFVYAKKTIKLLNDATLVSQVSHWNVRGPNFYESHQLFGRVYEALDSLMDGLVERLRTCGFNPDFEEFSGPGISMQNYDCTYLLNLNLDYVMAINSMAFMFFKYAGSKDDPAMVGITDYLQSMTNEIVHLQGLLQQALGH
jgi:hypothetical protein